MRFRGIINMITSIVLVVGMFPCMAFGDTRIKADYLDQKSLSSQKEGAQGQGEFEQVEEPFSAESLNVEDTGICKRQEEDSSNSPVGMLDGGSQGDGEQARSSSFSEGKMAIWAAGINDSSSMWEVYPSDSQDGIMLLSDGSSVSPMVFSDEMLYFCKYESSCNYDQGLSSGDDYHAMGYFQFDNRYGLGEFLKAVYQYNPQKYWALEQIGEWYGWDTYGDENGDVTTVSSPGGDWTMADDLNWSWHQAYAADAKEFSQLQNGWAYDQYYDGSLGVRKTLKAMGINIDGREDCVKGLVWGMTNLFGPGGGASYVNSGYYYGANWFFKNSGINDSMSDEEFVTVLCNYVVDNVAKRYPNQPQYHKGWQNRYRSELKDCLNYIAAAGDLSLASVSASGMSRDATGSALSPSVSVAMGGRALSEGADYAVLYDGRESAPSSPGSYEVTIEGRGSYRGTAKVGTFVIYDVSLSGVATLANAASPSLVLDAAGVSPEDGANVTAWHDLGRVNQRWVLEPAGDGSYVVRNAASPSLVLDAAGVSPEDGANVTAWHDLGRVNQRWVIR